jgi:divalent metal cation (Fe/Co/Zn/Cd) transporter
MRLVALAVSMGLYLAGVVALVQLVPGITPRQAAAIVGAALLAGSGGLVVTHLVQRHRRRSIGPADPPP